MQVPERACGFRFAANLAKMEGMTFVEQQEAERRLQQSFELLEVQKELNKAGDAAKHPGLEPQELERRFWRRMRARKDAQWN